MGACFLPCVKRQVVILFLGINGTGKTTTIAKFTNMLRQEGYSVVMAAGDTHRAGAIEQLTQHGDNLSVKVISQRYGADPSAVGRDAIEYAKKHYVDVVLLDTAGRMQTAKNLMDEISKIVRVVKPDLKIFVGDSLAGNDTINQAKEFYQYTSFDGAILTKTDADSKGGAAISIAHITSKPILYIGIGQGYSDIVKFDKDTFMLTLFGDDGDTSAIDIANIKSDSSKEKMIIDQKSAIVSENEIINDNVMVSPDNIAIENTATEDTTKIYAVEKNDKNNIKDKEPSLTPSETLEEEKDNQRSGLFKGIFKRKNKKN